MPRHPLGPVHGFVHKEFTEAAFAAWLKLHNALDTWSTIGDANMWHAPGVKKTTIAMAYYYGIGKMTVRYWVKAELAGLVMLLLLLPSCVVQPVARYPVLAPPRSYVEPHRAGYLPPYPERERW